MAPTVRAEFAEADKVDSIVLARAESHQAVIGRAVFSLFGLLRLASLEFVASSDFSQ